MQWFEFEPGPPWWKAQAYQSCCDILPIYIHLPCQDSTLKNKQKSLVKMFISVYSSLVNNNREDVTSFQEWFLGLLLIITSRLALGHIQMVIYLVHVWSRDEKNYSYPFSTQTDKEQCLVNKENDKPWVKTHVLFLLTLTAFVSLNQSIIGSLHKSKWQV